MKKKASDYGTTEISRQFKVVPRLRDGGFGYSAKVMDETEIDRMLLKDIINPYEHAVLERFLSRLRKARIGTIQASNYETSGKVDQAAVGDRMANKVRSAVKMFTRIDEELGADKRKALVNTVISDLPYQFDTIKSDIDQLSRILDETR